MTARSNYAAAQITAYFVQLVPATQPTQFYLALCSSAPVATQTGATIPELTSTGGYARVAVTFDGTNTIAGSSTSGTSSAAYSAGATHYAIVDSPTIGAGNLWYYAPLGSTLTISAANQVALIAAGTIVETLS